jgi:c-di-GMP-binding flagellar brake protein YcgR
MFLPAACSGSEPMVWPWKERRKYERIKVAVPCRLQVGERVLTGTTRDVSLGGICFPVELDEAIRTELVGASGTASTILPRGTMEADARVVRAEPNLVAVRFVGLKGTADWDTLREFLETQVSRLSAAVPDGSGEED